MLSVSFQEGSEFTGSNEIPARTFEEKFNSDTPGVRIVSEVLAGSLAVALVPKAGERYIP